MRLVAFTFKPTKQIRQMRSIITIILAITLTSTAYAQNADGCDGSRYVSSVFDEVTVTSDIKYGEGNLFPTEEFQELFMDVYEPVGDEVENRPVVMLAFGGSFIEGTKTDIDWLCETFAQRGYVAVSIDYRLYSGALFPPPNATQMRNVVMRAVSDMKGAIRYLRQDAANGNTYGIDPDQIFVGGISAGSILACHVAVLDDEDDLPQEIIDILDANGGIEGNTNDITDFSSEVAGLINYSGGLNDASWIDANDPPFYSVHDENDNIVPFGTGFATVFGFPIIYMEGSNVLKQTADSLGLQNKIRVFENSVSHVGYFFNSNNTELVLNETAAFVHDLLCPDFAVATTETVSDEALSVYPNPTSGQISIDTKIPVRNIVIINDIGQVIGTYQQGNAADVSMLESGIYFLKITNLEGQVTTRRLIVR